MTQTNNKTLCLSDEYVSLATINHIAAESDLKISLSKNTAYQTKLQRGVDLLQQVLKEDGVIYGVTTGYGDSCSTLVAPELIHELPLHLTRYHGCGLGEIFNQRQTRAIMATRLVSLAKGFSGVRPELLQQIILFLNHNILPQIPAEGSVGASGDLTPLSYLAAVLIGEREVLYREQLQPSMQVLTQLNIQALSLKPKEGLALMNGTAVMTALACEAYQRTAYLCRLSARLTAMATVGLMGNAFHFDQRLFAVKPHPGQQQVAAWIDADLQHDAMPRNCQRLQNRYSIRCAPHVIGVIADSLDWYQRLIENEINSANDNPIIDGEAQCIMHGGHFYGGHIASVMDTMKTQVANIADLLDRQMALLVDPKFNQGLPPNLTGAKGPRAAINHGFKAVQIAVSAWTAEALKLTMPASVFSRSTECHNQDKVSMGTIAARDCLRVLTLVEQVTAAHILVTCQAVQCRLRQGDLRKAQISPALQTMLDQVADKFTFLDEDRPLDASLKQFVSLIQQAYWEFAD